MSSLSDRTWDFVRGVARVRRRNRLKVLDVPASRFDEIVDDVKENTPIFWCTLWSENNVWGYPASFYLYGVQCRRSDERVVKWGSI